ncbi:MAG TPA: GntR family transcriptional regulator [Pirellulales bacterium]|nr:GntR family transcriptional regulator [Pirellulales bacterium]
MFHVSPTSGLPIYRQLVDQVRRHAASGRLKPHDYLPSVRQVALELQINPMTVSKAYSILEREKVVELVRGQGMRIAERSAPDGIEARQAELLPLVRRLAREAQQLSLSEKQVQSLLARAIKELDGK